jgi:transposase InsO family protein
MRIFNKYRGTRGFVVAAERGIRWRYMITKTAIRRTETLAFWSKHGLSATLDAFKVKRRTLFNWQGKLKQGGGKLEALNPKSRAPKTRRIRVWEESILVEIRRLRDEHPNLGKDKLYPLLKEFCDQTKLSCPRPSTIGRLIKDLGGLRLFPARITGTGRLTPINRTAVVRKPKQFKAEYPGHCIGLDTIEEIVHGSRRYVITCEDLFGRFAFAWATKSHASKAATEFFTAFRLLFPYPVTFVLTDNGSEWKKHFAEELLKLQVTHYHTYPKTPKMNAHIERFNRTIQEEFLNYHKGLLIDLEQFNTKLMDWLTWYNTKRVHYAFDNKLTPVQFLLSWRPMEMVGSRLPAECKNGWPHTQA